MLDDWNGDGKIDFEDQMLQDEFDDWAMEQYRKRNPLQPRLPKQNRPHPLLQQKDWNEEDEKVNRRLEHVARAPVIPAKAIHEVEKRNTNLPVLILVVLLFVLLAVSMERSDYPTPHGNPEELLPMSAAKQYFAETGKQELEMCLRQCGEAPLEDLQVEAIGFRQSLYTGDGIEIECKLAFRSDAISQYAGVTENSTQAFALRSTMEAIRKEVEEHGTIRGLKSKDGYYRLVYEMENSIDYHITDSEGKKVRLSGAYVEYGDRNITVLAPWATTVGLKRAAEERKQEEERKQREEKTLKRWIRSHKNTSSMDRETQHSKSSTRRNDTYDVYDYDDPEDFYYDHEDEFEDFEDAEDYYDEAWG